jgi:hypothetical protein
MKFIAKNNFVLDKKIIIRLYNLFFVNDISLNQYENLRIERTVIRRYNNTIRIPLTLEETVPLQSKEIDELISIKY